MQRIKALIPAGILAAVFGGAATAEKAGWVPDFVAIWLWPSILLLVLVAMLVFALVRRNRILIAPMAVGALTAAVGLVLALTEVFESPWEPIIYTLLSILIVCALMLAFWGIQTIRSRVLERKLAEGMAMGQDGNAEQLGRIRQDMLQALDLLKRAGRGRNAIYELPWFLVMGRPAAGKTVAIKNSGMGLPVKKDWVKGVGGTYTCDWFFTNEMIFLDTPGKWVIEGAGADAQKVWQKLLQLLARYRGRRPLDGLIVTVPADDLLSLSEERLKEQARNIREVVDLIHSELSFRFPVYLLVTKADLIEGFVDFAGTLPPQRRQEIFGWSNSDPNSRDATEQVSKGFRRVVKRLEDYRMELLGRVASRSKSRRLFHFSEEFKELEAPLDVFSEEFFADDRYHEVPVLRGVYFTSGTQGEGSPLSRAMAGFAQSLGVTVPASQEGGEEESKRSYFLLDMFREVMVRDEGLVGRTAQHWWKHRRNTMLGAFAPAGFAVGLLLFSVLSFFLNRGVYQDFKDHAVDADRDPVLTELASGQRPFVEEDVLEALTQTGRLRDDHRKMAVWSPFRSLGMRRPGALKQTAFDTFGTHFRESVLEPMLGQASRVASDAEADCVDRIDILHSVVWLRMGRRFQTGDDLQSLDRLWGLNAAEAEAARDELLSQFRHYERYAADDESLLPGFRLGSVAQNIKDDCDQKGATSTLAQFHQFQQECRSAVRPEEVVRCYGRLNDVLDRQQIDFERFARHFQALKSDLGDLRDEEPQAARAFEVLEGLDLGEQETSDCLVRFEQEYAPDIKNYVVQDDILNECKDAVAAATGAGRFTARDQVLLEREAELEEQATLLNEDLANFSMVCRTKSRIEGFRSISFDTLKTISSGYRRAMCLPMGLNFDEEATVATAEAVVPTQAVKVPSGASPPRKKAAPRRGGYDLFSVGRGRAASSTVDHVRARLQEWQARLDSTSAGFNESQKQYEETQVRGEIKDFARRIENDLTKYAESVSFKRRSGTQAEWLRKIADSGELNKILDPVAEVGRAAAGQTDAPFSALPDSLNTVGQITVFVDEKLPEYKARLVGVADALDQCASDSTFFRNFRASFNAKDASNPLVAAQSWVRSNGGSTLSKLLAEPLDEAAGFVRSDSLLKGEWASMAEVYRDEVATFAPFNGDLNAEPVSEEGLIAFFGRQSGAVTRVRQAAEAGGLSAEGQRWLEYAERVSAIFFDRDSDTPRPVPVLLAAGEPVYEPPELGKKNKIVGTWVVLGESEFKAEADDDVKKRMEMPVFGDYGFVRGNISKKKGLKRFIGKNWADAEFEPFTELSEPFAPLKVLMAGLSGAPSGSEFELTYPLDFEFKKDEEASFILKFTGSGEEIAELLRIASGGMEAPPQSIGGN